MNLLTKRTHVSCHSFYIIKYVQIISIHEYIYIYMTKDFYLLFQEINSSKSRDYLPDLLLFSCRHPRNCQHFSYIWQELIWAVRKEDGYILNEIQWLHPSFLALPYLSFLHFTSMLSLKQCFEKFSL